MNNSTLRLKIGKNIRKSRLELNLTQSDVAKKSEISVNYYARIERGEVNPTAETLKAISSVLKMKSSDILPL